jgi:tetratricopeptide (TPR) repeat protein
MASQLRPQPPLHAGRKMVVRTFANILWTPMWAAAAPITRKRTMPLQSRTMMGRSASSHEVEALAERGDAHERAGLYDRAAEDYSRLIVIEPNNAKAWNNRCWDRAVLGRLEEALADCNEALRVAPDDPGTLDSRGFTNTTPNGTNTYSFSQSYDSIHNITHKTQRRVRLRPCLRAQA